MKKSYVRPTLTYESFKLSASVANNCHIGLNSMKLQESHVQKDHYRIGAQAIEEGSFAYQGVCESEKIIETYCYTNGSRSSVSIFGS